MTKLIEGGYIPAACKLDQQVWTDQNGHRLTGLDISKRTPTLKTLLTVPLCLKPKYCKLL